MIIPDTSVWVEFFRGHQPYRSRLAALIEQGRVIAYDVIFGELLQGARDQFEIELIEGYYHNLPKPANNDTFIAAGLLSFEERAFVKGVGLIDTAILCAARTEGAKIWSLDQKLCNLALIDELYQ